MKHSTSLDKRLLAEARLAHRPLLLTVVLSAASAGTVIIQALLFSQIINRVFLLHDTLDDVAANLIALLFVIAVRAAFTRASTVTSAQVAIMVKTELRRRFLTHVTALGPVYTQGERSGELVLTVTEGINKLDPYFRDYLPAVLNAVLIPLLILLCVVPLDTLTFMVLLITASLIPLFMALIGMAAGVMAKRQFLEMRFLGAHFLDVMQGLPTLKLFNRSQYQVQTIERFTGQFREATMRVLRVAFLSAFSLEMLATLSVAIVAVEIGVRLLHGGIEFESAFFLLVIAPEFYQPLRALGAKFHTSTEGKAAAERLFQVLDTPLPPQIRAGSPIPATMHIRFEDVTFAYDHRARRALNGLSFDVQPGQRVALVGSSGGGKSTVASLLLRFTSPDAGKIWVDDVDLTHLSPDAWRERIAWVSQSPYLFNTTVADNIRFGQPDASMDQVIDSAEAASAHEFIMQLPQGYDTPCGERGLRLSGGQAQRIAIARAFLRDARFLILDEVTSSLDPNTEAEIESVLVRLMGGRTVLMIAHRLETVRSADQILVIEAGTVVEQGTHDGLMANEGVYYHLVQTAGEDTHAV